MWRGGEPEDRQVEPVSCAQRGGSIDENGLGAEFGFCEQRACDLFAAEEFFEGGTEEDRLCAGGLDGYGAVEFEGSGCWVNDQIAPEIALFGSFANGDEAERFLLGTCNCIHAYFLFTFEEPRHLQRLIKTSESAGYWVASTVRAQGIHMRGFRLNCRHKLCNLTRNGWQNSTFPRGGGYIG